ncbi:Electroneutral sodium bicarbonate exchanger 1 [Cichlidogyrus casuarinus]|uniref:Electroneutral sodium bicarbonate exchanger 1 n=1 Tax=Cichlidogyrus casuarinus TaxID=1844966 RepID=A0ABD2Q0J6_9PLAT
MGNGITGQQINDSPNAEEPHKLSDPANKTEVQVENAVPDVTDVAENGGDGGGDHFTGGDGSDPKKNINALALHRTGRFCGGLILDIKRKLPWYASDFKDALSAQCFGSFFFLYFACLAPIITFGGLLSQETGGNLGTIESILSGAIVGIIYALFSGQPLTIQGSTGPLLVFEKIIYTLCKNFKFSYLPFRLWIGMWIALFLLAMVAFDLSALVQYITRFTEESFATLIACIFIMKAIEKLIDIRDYAMVDRYVSSINSIVLFCLRMRLGFI